MFYTYDGTFQGIMTVIFQCYRTKMWATSIFKEGGNSPGLFDQVIRVATNDTYAERVLRGLRKKISPNSMSMLYKSVLSEEENVPIAILNYVRHVLNSPMNVEDDNTKNFVVYLKQISYKVDRENHRMHAFVRFEETKDGLYAATISPDFDVLPITGKHFKNRYPAMRWLIYDTRRRYGIYHEPNVGIKTVEIEGLKLSGGKLSKQILSETEQDLQQLWKDYFEAVNIPERKNPKLHLQHVPRRYWKYLPEKYL